MRPGNLGWPSRRVVVAAAAIVVGIAGGVPAVSAVSGGSARLPVDRGGSPAKCGAQDTPETGVQGDVPRRDQLSGRAEQGYNCGLAVIGHNSVGGLAVSGLAWSSHCAYVAVSGGLVKVIDVSDARHPKTTATLGDADHPTSGQAENIHAVTTRDRAILVSVHAPAGGGPLGALPVNPVKVLGGGSPVPADVWDVKADCAHPVLRGTIQFPGNVHNIELDPSATHVYASMPLQRADISNLAKPTTWRVVNFQCEIGVQTASPLYPHIGPVDAHQVPCDAWPKGVVAGPSQIAHEFEFNKTGTRMYIGDQNAYPGEQALHIVNISKWPQPAVIATLSNINGSTGGHGIRRMAIGGHPYLLNANETAFVGATTGSVTSPLGSMGVPVGLVNQGGIGANGCITEHAAPYVGAAQGWITDIRNERAPKTVSELRLAINDRKYCANQIGSGVNATIHYEGIDNPDKTTFVMAPMKNAGLRIFDVRTPRAPKEVAYFNPGQYRLTKTSTVLDRARMHTYYDAVGGHIWLTTEAGGFWVLELEPQVRHALGLPTRPAFYPHGRPARPGAIAGAVFPVSEAVLALAMNVC